MKTTKILLGLAYGLLLASCQSTPKAVPPAETAPAPAPVTEVVTPAPAAAAPEAPSLPDQIRVSRDGFSPLAAPPNHTLTASLQWSDPSKLVEWAVVFSSEGADPARTIRGTDAVPNVDWDGKTDSGVLAPQGYYQAILQTAGSDGVLVERARSIKFLLDIVPPSGTITASPLPFVPSPPDVIVEPISVLTIGLNIVSGGAPWTTWRLAVFHPDGRRFRDFISEDHRDNQVIWDGRAINNAQLEPGTTYRLEAEVYDIYGNKGTLTTDLPIAAPVQVQAVPAPAPAPAPVQPVTVEVKLNGEVLAELPVYFPAYSSDLTKVSGTQLESNHRSLQRLADLLLSAPGTEVTLVGHANQVFYDNAAKAAYEQKETLLPLSLARADAVKKSLIDSGVPETTLVTSGVGAASPVVPFSDAENRWKNRRVVVELK